MSPHSVGLMLCQIRRCFLAHLNILYEMALLGVHTLLLQLQILDCFQYGGQCLYNAAAHAPRLPIPTGNDTSTRIHERT